MTRGANGLQLSPEGGWTSPAKQATPAAPFHRPLSPVAWTLHQRIVQSDPKTASELMRAVIDVAATSFDVDVRVYRRMVSGCFVLDAALHPTAVDERQRRISGSRLRDLSVGVPRRVRASSWTWASGLAWMIGFGRQDANWALMLHGRQSREAAEVFVDLTPALTSLLTELQQRRLNTFTASLRLQVSSEVSSREAARIAARETAAAIDACSSRVLLRVGGSQHTLAAWPAAASAPRGLRRGDQTTPHRVVSTATLEPSTTVTLEVLAGRGEFDLSAAAFVAAGAEVIRDALARTGLRASLESPSSRSREFEQRLREEILRAKRYDLGLSVVVVRARQARLHGSDLRSVASLLKDGLRRCDLVGRIAPGALGVLLLHTPAPVAGRVVSRLEQRIVERAPRQGDEWGVGVASLASDCASPGAMIARALRDVRPVMPD